MKLHEYGPSGNCYKVRLLLTQLGRAFERVPVDLTKGEGKTPAFRARFPLGRVPVLELGDGRLLGESNAIILFLAEGTPFIPADPFARAQALQWLFWEQYSHEPYVAVARAWLSFFGIPAGKEAELVERQAKGVAALETMERHLAAHSWFAGDAYSVADISLYAYTHVAGEGGFQLERYPALCAWMDRVASQPGHLKITD
jgi:glutathione S-transferase